MLNKHRVLTILCDELKQRPILQFACKKAGVSRSQLYRWMKDDVNFATQVNEAQREGNEVVNDFSVSKLLNGINNDNLAAVFFWLRHRHPDFSNTLNVNMKQEVSYALTDEQKKLIADALKMTGLTNAEKEDLKTLIKGGHDA